MGEVLVARGARTWMDVAASAEDSGCAGCRGSSSRETMVIVEAVKVSGGVAEWARSWWSRGESPKSLE